MTEAQKCLHHIAENMRMDKSISKEGYEYFQQAIKALEQEPKWIPVSERLPKEEETVLVCYHEQGEVAYSVCEWFDIPNRGIVWSTLCGKEPIAWMPLPEPYKAESEDKE